MKLGLQSWLCIALVTLLISQTGCLSLSAFMGRKRTSTLDFSTLKAQGYSLLPGGPPSPISPSNSSSGPRMILEVRDDERHLESIPYNSERPQFIQDLVQEAELNKKLGRLSIYIMRPLGEGKAPLRLDLRTDSKGRVTNVGQNYALHPGDHIIVIADTRTSLERFIDNTIKKED